MARPVVMPDSTDLHERILAGHAAGDGHLLAQLYAEAGQLAAANGEVDKACYFFTQAYVFALEAGENAVAEKLQAILRQHGREE